VTISIRLREIKGLEFGSLNTAILHATSDQGEPIEITIDLANVGQVVPPLLHATTVALLYQWPTAGTPLLDGHIAVHLANPYPAKDTKDAALTVHTSGGTLHLLFPPEIRNSLRQTAARTRCRSVHGHLRRR